MTVSRDKYTDDIDLLDLLERSISFFKRYRWIFIVSIVLGLAFGFYFYKAITKTYESKMLVHSSVLTNQEEIQITRNWNALLGKKEWPALARELNMDESLLRKVKKIKAEEIQQVFTPVNPHGFTILAVVTDTAVLDELQQGLVYGFETSPYVKDRLKFNREALEEMIKKTETEIQKLDSTKNTIQNIISGKERTSSSLIVDGSSISTRLIEMNEKLIGLKRDLRFTNAVQVLQDFQKFSKPSDPNLIPLLVIGLVVFLAFGYILALFLSVNAGLRQRAMTRKQ